MNRKKTGVLFILGASLMWAVESVGAKHSYQMSSFLETSTVRAIVVSICAMVYMLITNRRAMVVTRKQLPVLIYIAVAGTVVADLLYFAALTKVSVVNAVLIGHMQPVFIVLFSLFVLKEDKLHLHDYIGRRIQLPSVTNE